MIIFESKLPVTYRDREISQILKLTLAGQSCQLVAAPGVGKATILKLLAHNRELLKHHLKEKEANTRFVYLNLLVLENLELKNITDYLEKELETDNLKQKINTLSNEDVNITLLFDHFDEYQNQLTRSFFQLLADLKSVAKYKFACVFASRRDLKDLIDQDIQKTFYEFFTDNTIYTKISDPVASDLILTQTEESFRTKLKADDRKNILAQSGGHAKLTKVLAEIAAKGGQLDIQNALVSTTLNEIWLSLTAQEQNALMDIAANKPVADQVNQSLVNLDLVSSEGKFTIAALEEFASSNKAANEKIKYDSSSREIVKGPKVLSDFLSKQEFRLLKYFLENEGKVIDREEIITRVWPDAQVKEGITNEAIDQMVFRLRKKVEDNPNTPAHIKTVKGQGWRFEA